MVVFVIHQHESAMGAHVSPYPEPLFHFPPHPIPLGCLRALALSALLHVCVCVDMCVCIQLQFLKSVTVDFYLQKFN